MVHIIDTRLFKNGQISKVHIPRGIAKPCGGIHPYGSQSGRHRSTGTAVPIGDVSEEIIVDEVRQDAIHRIAVYTTGTESDTGWFPERFRLVCHSSRYVKGDGKPATTAVDSVGTL
jgi:hypothetical protein